MSEGRRGERSTCGRGENSEDYSQYAEVDPAGRYGRFHEVLGKGAMKTVYRAFDEVDGLEVAWNQARIYDVMRSPEALQRLYSEVHLLSTLNHDSIISFHTSWVDPRKRTFNFITELFTSGTLREYRERYKRVCIRAVKKWARQILQGLVYLHGHNPPVIHRDLKCDNIFVNGHLGQVKIGDLGLAAMLRGSQAAHSVIGTPEFMAPELYDEEYNELVDIYSFGMCVVEMLTGEYPYNECSNPAQIYRKVTQGKLPDSFYRVNDPEARRFISRCLEHDASKRSPAKDLLLDPFLSIHGSSSPATLTSSAQTHRPACESARTKQSPDMKITGKINAEDDTIILKVQITDRQGEVQNIYFPFDVVSDTPMDVANEMVRELEITYRDPSQIADMIAREVSALVPDWKDPETEERESQSYVFGDEEDSHSFHELSSSTSTQGSVSCIVPSQSPWAKGREHEEEDEASLLGSTNCSRYSFEKWISTMEQETESHIHRSTRFCPDETNRIDCFAAKKHDLWPERRQLQKNHSLVDIRSQILHRALVEEVNKRIFNTVGSVESVGFQDPLETSPRGSSRRSAKNSGLTWGRG